MSPPAASSNDAKSTFKSRFNKGCLYLVTDSRPSILKGKSLVKVVEDAITSGVDIVQYRDKDLDDVEFIKVAQELQAVAKKHNSYFLINDRVEIAREIGADGVHIGQDDSELKEARSKLGKDAIIGVTVSNLDEAIKAAEGGADYLGIGTIYATPTKIDTASIIGIPGMTQIVDGLAAKNLNIPCVAIGGINVKNLDPIIRKRGVSSQRVDGVAVVSAIIGADDTKKAVKGFKRALDHQQRSDIPPRRYSPSLVVARSCQIVEWTREAGPLSHNMTNLVVQNFAANVALAIGASPIMAGYGPEALDLCKLNGALVVNMGSVDPEGLRNYQTAIRAYNAWGGPILFDPVGAGATQLRRDAVTTLMGTGHFEIIKGNEGEILTVAGKTGTQQKGVDSGPSTTTEEEKAKLVFETARRLGSVVVMTGKVDFVSDGQVCYAVRNGHELLGQVTGAGCSLGTVISACLAGYPGPEGPTQLEPSFESTIAGLLLFEIAAEQAAEQASGPGTFLPLFIDRLNFLSRNPHQLEALAKVDEIKIGLDESEN